MNSRASIQKTSEAVTRKLLEHVESGGGLCVVKAPPGSGKTYTLLQALSAAVKKGRRIAVATQTNAQADDICRRMLRDYPKIPLARFAANGSAAPPDLEDRLPWVTSTKNLPTGPGAVVATTAKWSLVNLTDTFDFIFIDEAWQMAWADFMPLGKVAPRFVLIGDPGQIPPVVSIPVERWETSPRAPHLPAPALILQDPGIEKLRLELPSCRRLPADSVDLVRPFYDFEFAAWAIPGERFVKATKPKHAEPEDRAIGLLETGSAAIATLPTPDEGPPLEEDRAIAQLASRIAVRTLDRKAVAASEDGDQGERLQPTDIGICATHRAMNSAILSALPQGLRHPANGIRVDTPERWQGLERKLMVVVHPLSGVLHPSSFDLETGRLCVMASRHRSGLVVVSRDHVAETLDTHIPSADQAVGRPDVSGRGHSQNLRFWQSLDERHRIVNCR